jgi:hypothetical protein
MGPGPQLTNRGNGDEHDYGNNRDIYDDEQFVSPFANLATSQVAGTSRATQVRSDQDWRYHRPTFTEELPSQSRRVRCGSGFLYGAGLAEFGRVWGWKVNNRMF